MLPIISAVFLSCAAVSFTVYFVGVWAAFRHTARTPTPETALSLPPITLLKPIKGLEEELEENLISFFEQKYPAEIQFVFASTEKDDPGIVLARRLASRYPNLDVAFVLSDPAFGLNPKVSNLRGALKAARHDTVLQSDANVRVRSGFLQSLAEEFALNKASLLGCLVVGVGERSIGAALENLHLTGFIGPSLCAVQRVADTTCVVGKAMIFRKSELEQLGGLAAVKDVLLEDFILGEIYRRAGKTVALSNQIVENVNIRTSVAQFLSRHSRWLKMTAVVSKSGMLAQLFSNPLLFVLLAWLSSGFDLQLLLLLATVILIKLLADAALVRRMRGFAMRGFEQWLSPIRDTLIGMIWLYALFSRTVRWRGKELRIRSGSEIVPEPPRQGPRISFSFAGKSRGR
ncbi:MAG: glycosyltransferase [Deltaproteobacteria bacterium]|nr:glycosyltransferase [Deltaproteobacteria bacterium]